MIIAIDTETYEYNQKDGIYEPVLDARKFVIGCAITDKGEEMIFYKKEDMLGWLKQKIEKNSQNKRRTYIYAHNTEYDWYAIANNEVLNEKMKYILFSPFLAIYDNKGYFLDTMAFYKTSLKAVGEMLGFNKLEMPKEIKEPSDLIPYVKRDTEIVMKAVLELKGRLSRLGFKPRKMLTSGQLAMTCFLTYCRKNYTEKYITEWNPEKKIRQVIKTKYAKLIREAYRGGDNQAHKTGKFQHATLLDINGLYADIMTKMPFPNLATENLQIKPSVGLFLKYIQKEIGVARITIKSPSTEHPVLPIRFGDYQIFPSNTEMRGTWTFIEIKTALEEGYKLEKVDWCIRWKELEEKGKKINPLKTFIEELYPIEQNSKSKAEKNPIKLLRNNLSGKFAQYRKNKDIKIVERKDAMKYVEQGYETKSKYNDRYVMIKETDTYEPSYTNPIISTYITALGRLRLHEEEKKVPVENRLYKDTDSLVFTDPTGEIRKEFDIGEGLGRWKIEATDQPCKILGEKRYYIGNQVKISGVHRSLREKSAIEKEENLKIKRMYGIGSAIRTGQWEKIGAFEEIEIEMQTHSKNMLPIPEKVDESQIEIEEDGTWEH